LCRRTYLLPDNPTEPSPLHRSDLWPRSSLACRGACPRYFSPNAHDPVEHWRFVVCRDKHHISSKRFACRLRPASSEAYSNHRRLPPPVRGVACPAMLQPATARAVGTKKGRLPLAALAIRLPARTFRSACHRRCLARHTFRPEYQWPYNGLQLG